MRPADLAKVITVSDPAVAPDGSAVAVVVERVDEPGNRTEAAIWLVPADSDTGRALTSGEVTDGHPTWSPDGSRLAFTRTVGVGDDARMSVLVMAADGSSDPTIVAEGPEAATWLDWSPTGDQLVWCARVPEVAPGTADRDRPPRQITTLMSRLDNVGWTIDRRTQVHVAPADGSAPPRVVNDGPFEHADPRWSPDGRTLVVVAGRHAGWDLDEVVDLWLFDAGPDAAAPRRLTDGTAAWAHPTWSPSGDRIVALRREVATGWHNSRVVAVDVATGAETDLAPGIDRTFAPSPGMRAPVFEPGGASVLTSCEDRGRVHVWRLDAAGVGEPELVVGGDRWVSGFDAAAGTTAVVVGDATHPGELEVGGHRTAFTAGFLAEAPALPAERFTVTSPAGDADIDAWLVTPSGWDPAAGERRWPLLLAIHGGPMTQYGDRWFDEFQLLAGAGYVVVAANPHGSTGREQAWTRAIRSPKATIEPGTGWGGIDADDLLAVVDATLERWPALDPDRVGVLGGSYGGFMTTWLLGHSDRFAAGCSERAVNQLWSEEWSSDVGGSFHRELGVSHLDDPGEYVRMSPVTYAADITDPILIIHSEQDLRCHPEQADALFVALRLLGHPDVEYWRFPGEGHELSRSGSPSHRRRRAEIIEAFFERTIGAGPRP